MANPYLPQYYQQRNRVFSHPWMLNSYNSFANVARYGVPAFAATARALWNVGRHSNLRRMVPNDYRSPAINRRRLRGQLSTSVVPTYPTVTTRPRYRYQTTHYLNKKQRLFRKRYSMRYRNRRYRKKRLDYRSPAKKYWTLFRRWDNKKRKYISA